jgi:hypothetical protein
MITEKNGGNVDQLSQNYKEMNETGREKLKQVAGHILDIWNTVHDESEKKKNTFAIKASSG